MTMHFNWQLSEVAETYRNRGHIDLVSGEYGALLGWVSPPEDTSSRRWEWTLLDRNNVGGIKTTGQADSKEAAMIALELLMD